MGLLGQLLPPLAVQSLGESVKFQVKKADFKDAELIGPLFDAYRVFYKKESDIALATDFIASRLKNNESTIYYAVTDNHEFIGFVQLYPTFSSLSAKRSWILNDLYVNQHARGLGVARQLMQAANKLALETNANGIALETAPDNESAQALYRSLGYKLESEYLHYFLSM